MMGGTTLSTDMLGVYFELAGRAAAAHVRSKGLPGHMREDLTQEGILWLLEHPGEIEAASDRDGKPYTSRLVGRIRMHYVRSGMDASGEDPFIDKRYTPEMVALAFPAVYDPEYAPFRERTEAGERFAKKDAAEGNNWLAIVADVSSAIDAYGRLEEGIRYVWMHEVLGEPYEAIAARKGHSRTTAFRIVSDTLSWLADWLNGDYQTEVEE
jgi:hypothetical protein